jgi:excisionase family DNA binding protein
MPLLLDQTREPIAASEEEALIAREAVERLKPLADSKQDVRLRVKGSVDIVVPLPAAAVEAITRVLAAMAERRPVSVVPMDAELTTQQAADMLNVSRPHLTKLLNEGRIPYRKVGTHRRVLVADALSFKADTRANQSRAIDDVVALSQDLGLD